MHLDASTILIFIAVFILLGCGTAYGIRSYFRQIKISRARKHGQDVEKDAPEVLKKMGFTDIQEQEEFRYTLKANDDSIKVELRPDIVAMRDGKKYIIDIKTGAVGKVDNAKTRRQLLEYLAFIEGDGIMMLNMDTKELFEYDFPNKPAIQRKKKKSKLFPVVTFLISATGFCLLSPNDIVHYAALVVLFISIITSIYKIAK
ncbi:MAG: hypothetical protein HUK20_09585 [Fibrobacter sp.]|nr:hypothetical protein [Fibrobacter sp.]